MQGPDLVHSKKRAISFPDWVTRQRCSTVLGTLALLFWMFSLSQIGFTFHNGFRLHGYKILMIGWQGPLQGSIAWFANPVFVTSMLVLYLRERAWLATALSLVAFAIALDTFRFDALRLDANGKETSVYGFGVGVVLWFVALTTAIIAAGTYLKEEQAKGRESTWIAELLRWLGIVSLVIVTMTSLRLYLLDRQHASGAEREYLKDVAFRLGPVCKVEQEIVSGPLTALHGPLEVVVSPSYLDKQWAGRLLAWGVPAIRVDGRDYWKENRAGEFLITSAPRHTRGASGATLIVNRKSTANGIDYHLALREGYDGRVIVNRDWRQEARNGRYCPDFDPYGLHGGQPRQLLQTGLGLPVKDPVQIMPPVTLPRPTHRAVVVSSSEASLRRNSEPTNTLGINVEGDADKVRNCPGNVRWVNRTGNSEKLLMLGENSALRIGDAVYYIAEPGRPLNGICADQYLYTLQSNAHSGKLDLWLTKRDMKNFDRIWKLDMWVEDPAFTGGDWKILDIRDDGPELTILIYGFQTKMQYTIRTILPDLLAKPPGQ